MRLLEKASIKRKQMLIIMFTTTVALLLVGLMYGSYEVISFRAVTLRNLTIIADVVGSSCAGQLDFGAVKEAEESLASLEAEPSVVAAAIYKDGNIFASYRRKGSLEVAIPSIAPDAKPSMEHSLMSLGRDIRIKGGIVGTIYIYADLSALYSRTWQFAAMALFGLGLAMLVALAFSFRLQRFISEPILQLSCLARQVAYDKNYALRAIKTSEDEIGQLVDGFNEMLSQIQARDNALESARGTLEHRVEERTAELANSLALLNATLESTADGILAVSREGNILCHNQTFIKLWEVPPQLMQEGKSEAVFELLANRLQTPEKMQRGVKAVGANADLELHDVLELNNGRIYERLIRPQLFSGECVGCVLSFRDVTDSRRAEAALRKSEERFRSIWADSIEAMVLTDATGDIVDVNPAFILLVDMDCDKLVGHSFPIIFGQEHTPGATDGYCQAFAQSAIPPRLATRHRLWNARELDLEISNSFVEVEGHGKLVLSIFRDVTERKLTESKLREAQAELMQASRRAGMAEIATNVLHNVGNVLNSVNTSAAIIADRARASKCAGVAKVAALLEEHKDDLAGFFTNSKRGAQLLQYIRMLSEQLVAEQAGVLTETELLRQNIEHIKEIVAMQQSYAKVSGVLELYSMANLIDDAVRMHAGALTQNGVEIVRNFEIMPEIMVERHKVLQILINLVSNAKHALAESGQADRVLTIGLTRTGTDRIAVHVRDNGIGIAPENLTRIFSHGFTTKRTGHGFGLHSGALAAKEMGGALRVGSDGVGKGATFTLELPMRSQQPVEGELQPPAAFT